MKITVFGASGGTGGELVRQACAAGHEVTAVVRDTSRFDQTHRGLTVVRADVMDPDAIGAAVAGRDAVVSAIGPRSTGGPTTVSADSVSSIIKAMTAHGVRRLVVVSASGMSTDGDGWFTKTIVKPILWRFLKHAWNDMLAMEDVVRRSGLDWTIMRPPQLTDGPRSGSYRSEVNRNVRGGFRISRADLADASLRQLADPSSVRASVALGN